MPTLKRVSNNSEKIGEKKRAIENNTNDDGGDTDDRFSQTNGDHDVQTKGQREHDSLSISSAVAYSSDSTVNDSFDVVGVVVSIQHPQKISSKANNINEHRARILIADYSLPNGHCVRVNISTEIALQPGDAVRLNRVEVRNVNDQNDRSPLVKKQRVRTVDDKDSEDVNMSTESNGLLKVMCDLYPSWKDPTAGPTLVRLCRINPSTTNKIADAQFTLDCEENMGSCNTTSPELIHQLANWYCSSKQYPYMQSSAQPCHRRKLRDITGPNMVSHVVVKVLRCEKATQKWSHGKAIEQCITHAILSDGPESEDIMGLHGSIQVKEFSGGTNFIPKSTANILLQALREGCYILLTRVVSKNTTYPSMGSEPLMLVTTRDTTALVITPDHPFYIRHSPLVANFFASQPLSLERASQLYTMSQQHSPGTTNHDKQGGCRGMMAVVSPLLDIIIDGLFASFREGRYWQTNQSLSKFLIDTPTISTPFKSIKLSPTYRSATILLDPSAFATDMVINADSDALKLLCLEVPPEDMVLDWNDDEGSHPYLSHVGALLKGLCEEKTPIRWVLEQESENSWFVMNATLFEI
ncbi:hypothetical protein ACHAXN_013012 [Cyclotella atomus]